MARPPRTASAATRAAGDQGVRGRSGEAMRKFAVCGVFVMGFLIGGCGLIGPSSEPTNGPYTTTVAPGLKPRLTAADAVSLSRDYLAQQAPQIAAPELHVPANITQVWAVRGSDAWTLDPCIPHEASSAIVWVTRGSGDYLNLRVHAWSSNFSQEVGANPSSAAYACLAPSIQGTLVIDDATGKILAVFPGEHSSPS